MGYKKKYMGRKKKVVEGRNNQEYFKIEIKGIHEKINLDFFLGEK